MSNRLFQGIIHQMKECIDRTFGVLDENMTVIACSELGRIGEAVEGIPAGSSEITTYNGYTYKSLGITQSANYTVFVEGEDILAGKYASVLAVSFTNNKFN